MKDPIIPPRNSVFTHKIKEGFICANIVGKKKPSGTKIFPCGVELPAHMVIGVQTVVDEAIDGSNIREKWL
jgi:hypothetical protein